MPESGDDGGSARTDHVDELVDVELPITVDVAHGKESLDLLAGEPGAGLPHLLLAEHSVPVVVHLSEQEPRVVNIADILRSRSSISLKYQQQQKNSV